MGSSGNGMGSKSFDVQLFQVQTESLQEGGMRNGVLKTML